MWTLDYSADVCWCCWQADMEKYCAEHPEYQPRVVKTFLSKAEQRIKDKVDGKPEKPPRYDSRPQCSRDASACATKA